MKIKHFHNGGHLTYTKYILCLLLTFLHGLSCLAFPGKYPLQNFMPSDYKAGIQNIGFSQNRDMTLFVANNLGILAYNGKSWEKHSFQTGKKQRSLAFDEKTTACISAHRGYSGTSTVTGKWCRSWTKYHRLLPILMRYGMFSCSTQKPISAHFKQSMSTMDRTSPLSHTRMALIAHSKPMENYLPKADRGNFLR